MRSRYWLDSRLWRTLGRKLSMQTYHDTEIQNRIHKAWGKFAQFKTQLCCRHYSLRRRLRLFDMVVTPTLLYASGCWTMTAERTRKIRTAQRRMMRSMARIARRPAADVSSDDDSTPDNDDIELLDISQEAVDPEVETWVEWMIRSTAIAERSREEAGVESWIAAQRRRYWRWAGHVARCNDLGLAPGRWFSLQRSSIKALE